MNSCIPTSLFSCVPAFAHYVSMTGFFYNACLSLCLLALMSLCLPESVFFYQPLCLPAIMITCMPLYRSAICLYAYMTDSMNNYLPVCLHASVSLHYLSFYLSLCLLSVGLYAYIYISCLSVCMCTFLHVR